MSEPSPSPDRGALERVLLANLEEQRRARRWGILFKSLGFAWLFMLLILVFLREDGDLGARAEHTALIELGGEIGGEDGIRADAVLAALASAFDNTHSKAVVLRCNSPGGSPVQAGQIHDEIKRLRARHKDKPVYAVVDEICASGGYYIAAAADRIYVDKASIVGSIGVLMNGFGFTRAMDKLGVERRLLTAGDSKGFLDPFSPVDPRQEAHARAMLDEIHQQFITVVRQGRGERLKEDPDLFSGLVWSGNHAIGLGLADELGSLDQVARDVVKAENVIDYTPTESLADRLARRIGTAIGEAWRPAALNGFSLR